MTKATTARRLRRVVAVMEAEPKRSAMRIWLARGQTILDRGLKVPDCKTVGCIAGWAVMQYGDSDEKRDSACDRVRASAERLLGLTRAQSNALFVDIYWPLHLEQRLYRSRPQTAAHVRLIKERVEHFIEHEL